VKPFIVCLVILALLFFIAAAAVAGGVISMSGPGWLVPGGLAALALAWMLSLIP